MQYLIISLECLVKFSQLTMVCKRALEVVSRLYGHPPIKFILDRASADNVIASLSFESPIPMMSFSIYLIIPKVSIWYLIFCHTPFAFGQLMNLWHPQQG